MRRKTHFTGKTLEHRTRYTLSFSDVDSMGVMWHGHYTRLLEYGREAWGQHYGMGYMDVYRHGFMIPIVQLTADYKAPLRYEDSVDIHAKFLAVNAAKLMFEYELYRHSDQTLVCTASTTQVFIDSEHRELQIALPPFFEAWLNEWKLI